MEIYKFICANCGKEGNKKRNVSILTFKSYKNHFCNNKCLAEWKKENTKGEKNNFFGKKHTKGTIDKMKNYKKTGIHKNRISETRKRLFIEGILKNWNEGLKKENNEIIKKISENCSLTRKKLFKDGKLKLSGVAQIGDLNYSKINGSWNKGKISSEETKRKSSETMKRLFKEGKLIANFKGKHHTEETKKIMREKRKSWILPVKDTSIEIKIQDFLKQLSTDFFTHQYINIQHGYQCDIWVPSMNLVIECDGDYWHKYPTGRDIDKIRTSEIIEKGFKVLRLWEFEIKEMNINNFKNRLYKYEK